MDRTIQVGERGTLVLPDDWCEKYRIRSGDSLRLIDLNGTIMLMRVSEEGSAMLPSSGDSTTTTWDELTRLGEEIGREWCSPLAGAELLSEMR